jgi:hypothetical protein
MDDDADVEQLWFPADAANRHRLICRRHPDEPPFNPGRATCSRCAWPPRVAQVDAGVAEVPAWWVAASSRLEPRYRTVEGDAAVAVRIEGPSLRCTVHGEAFAPTETCRACLVDLEDEGDGSDA